VDPHGRLWAVQGRMGLITIFTENDHTSQKKSMGYPLMLRILHNSLVHGHF